MMKNFKTILKSGVALSVLLLSTETFGAATITIPGAIRDDVGAAVSSAVTVAANGYKSLYVVDNAVTNANTISVGADAILQIVAVNDGVHDSKLTQSGVVTLADGATIRVIGNATTPSVTFGSGALSPAAVKSAKIEVMALGISLPDLSSFSGLDVVVNNPTSSVTVVSKLGGALTVASGAVATLLTLTEITGGLKGAGDLVIPSTFTIKGATKDFEGTIPVGTGALTLENPPAKGTVTIGASGGTGVTTTKAGTIKKVVTGGSAKMAPQDNLTISTLDLTGGICTFGTLAGKKVTISAIANPGSNLLSFTSGQFDIRDTVTVGNTTWTVGNATSGTVKKVVFSHVSGSIIAAAGDLVIEELDITAATGTVTLNPASGKTITVKKLTGAATGAALVIGAAGTVIFPSWDGTVSTNSGTFKTK